MCECVWKREIHKIINFKVILETTFIIEKKVKEYKGKLKKQAQQKTVPPKEGDETKINVF